jgi:hypothetical protein
LEKGSGRRIVVIGCQIGLAMGLALVVAGALWQALARPEHVWSEAKAEEFRQAQTVWHNLQYDDSGLPSSERADLAKQREAAQRHFEGIQADLERAISTHRHRGTRLMYSGLAAMVFFGVGYLSAREPDHS